ncbi:MAG: radical SAM protein [Candidatus Omnitrophica bacterium]|nr:radical SAM protein [Candidatus Omnitrophota bacterium]
MPKVLESEQHNFRYIYGPVYSWRLGMSLGIDPISTAHKVCNFDCTYCQLGAGNGTENKRRVFVPSEDIIREVNALPEGVKVDYYTFSGRGEPTLAKNLGEMISLIKRDQAKKVAVITNSTLLGWLDVQADLMRADFILAKMDAFDDKSFKKINRPDPSINYVDLIEGIKNFRRGFKNKFALQIMFSSENQEQAEIIARAARDIAPDEIQINTPLRPSDIHPLDERAMAEIKKTFKDLPVVMVYDVEKRDFLPFDEQNTVLRHGKFKGK